jgi:hypothetical protein
MNMRGRCLAAMIVTLAASGGCKRPDGEDGAVTSPFNDPQVAGLAVVETDHQVQTGTAVLGFSLMTIPPVLAYAQHIVTEMAAARDRLVALAAAQGIPVDQSTTEAKSGLMDTTIDVANSQPDAAYLEDSVHDVGKAIKIWDNTILPNVSNAALKAELENTRALLGAEEAAGMQLEQDTGIPPKK